MNIGGFKPVGGLAERGRCQKCGENEDAHQGFPSKYEYSTLKLGRKPPRFVSPFVFN